MPLLLKGDCLEVMRDLSDNSVDCFICDLPYGCLSNNSKPKISKETAIKYWGNHGNILQSYGNGCAWDVKIDLKAFWKEVKRIRRNDHSPCIHFCSAKFGFDLYASNPTEFRYDVVWAKTNAVGFLSANKKPMASHEMIYVFSKKGAYYNRKDISGNFPAGGGGTSTATFLPIAGMPNLRTTEAGRRCVTSVITVPNKKRKGGHPTEKPVELYRWLLERYCPAGGTVLDPTFGSGNSVFTAHEMGLSAIGIEKDDGFYKKAADRLSNTIQHVPW